MSRVYIKFSSDSDRIKGVYALATQASVDSLPEGVFGISAEDLYILKNERIKYSEASPEEVAKSYQKLRTFWNKKPSEGIKSKAKSKIKHLAQAVSTHLKL